MLKPKSEKRNCSKFLKGIAVKDYSKISGKFYYICIHIYVLFRCIISLFVLLWFDIYIQITEKRSKRERWGCFQFKSSKKTSNDELEGYRIFLQDGTEVEDEEYFLSIPSQSLLIVSDTPNLVYSSKIFKLIKYDYNAELQISWSLQPLIIIKCFVFRKFFHHQSTRRVVDSNTLEGRCCRGC